MAWWEVFFPIQSPLSGPQKTKPDTVPHPPITTRKGRVIYDRKMHFFSDADLARISANVLGITEKRGTIEFWLQLLERLTVWMLDKVLGVLFLSDVDEEVSERLYQVARNFLAKLIDKMLAKEQDKLRDDVSGGAH